MNKRRVNVKKHQRVMPDGRVLNVKRHNRSIELKRNRNAAGGHIAAQIAARGASRALRNRSNNELSLNRQTDREALREIEHMDTAFYPAKVKRLIQKQAPNTRASHGAVKAMNVELTMYGNEVVILALEEMADDNKKTLKARHVNAAIARLQKERRKEFSERHLEE